MSIVRAVLDASNIAYTRAAGSAPRVRFRRVEEVREAWLEREPGVEVRAFLDAATLRRLSDRPRAGDAREHGWLVIAPGDADDLILELADRHGAVIVSNDRFLHARDRYRWLDGSVDRVYSASWRGGNLLLQPRVLEVATPEQIARAQAEKRRKAGILTSLGDEVWHCAAPANLCAYAGGPVPHELLRRRGQDAAFHCVCGFPAEERLAVIPDIVTTGQPALAVLFGGRSSEVIPIGRAPRVLGRGGPRRPDVVDVTAGLAPDQAREISRRHVEVLLDDDDQVIARHLAPTNSTFLNPRLDAAGVPVDNRLRDEAEYLLDEGDRLLLGPGAVILLVVVHRAPAR